MLQAVAAYRQVLSELQEHERKCAVPQDLPLVSSSQGADLGPRTQGRSKAASCTASGRGIAGSNQEVGRRAPLHFPETVLRQW